MKRGLLLILVFWSISLLCGYNSAFGVAGSLSENEVRGKSRNRELESKLKTLVCNKDARIGVAVIINDAVPDTISANGNEDFPMLSVYKFPEAIAVADYCSKHDISLEDEINISASEMRSDTWSPMRDKYGRRDVSLPLSEVLAYSVVQSDNNACDVLFRLIGGTQYADSVMNHLGFGGIHILSTEEEMHADTNLCYANRATPLQMAALFDRFYRLGLRYQSPILDAVGSMMMRCNTGKNRLPFLLPTSETWIGHKTGTGDINGQGRIIGVNDAGFVFLPDNRGYSIAVFVADSEYDMPTTEKIIADISRLVFSYLEPAEGRQNSVEEDAE